MADQATHASIKQVLDRIHPTLSGKQEDYTFLRQAYEGGRPFIERHLFRHSPRETQADYDRRKAQAVYPNFVRSTLKIYRDHVYKRGEAIRRDVRHDAFRTFQQDVDRTGRNANAFWGSIGMSEMLYGWCAVLVDMPPLPDLGRDVTVADVREHGMTPYYVAVPPTSLVDWSTDAFGRLNWVHIAEDQLQDRSPFDRRQTQRLHRIWDRESWALYDDTGNLRGSGQHGLGEVPLVMVRFEESHTHDFIGTSFMEDYARLNRALANSISLRHDFLAKNALQILTVQIQPMSDDDDGAEDVVIRNLLEYGGERAPQFVGPDVSGAEWMFRHVEDLRDHMYFLAMMPGNDWASHRQESGLANPIDFEQTNAALAGFADGLEAAEVRAAQLWCRWQGIPWDDAWTIDYPDSFNIRSMENELAIAHRVRDTYGPLSPTFAARYLEAAAGRIFEDLSEADRRRVADELLTRLNTSNA